MQVEVRMVMSEYINLTRHTLISLMRLRDRPDKRNYDGVGVTFRCICGRYRHVIKRLVGLTGLELEVFE